MSQKILFKLMHWVSVFRLMFELIKYMDFIIYIYIYIFIYTLEHKYTKSSNPKQNINISQYRNIPFPQSNQNGLQYKTDSLTQYYSKNQFIWPAYLLSSPFTSSFSIFLTQLQVSKFYPFTPDKTLRPFVGGKDLNFYVGPQAPFTNKNASKEEKMLGKAPQQVVMQRNVQRHLSERVILLRLDECQLSELQLDLGNFLGSFSNKDRLQVRKEVIKTRKYLGKKLLPPH